jgi:CheY-like chemotaxis protein
MELASGIDWSNLEQSFNRFSAYYMRKVLFKNTLYIFCVMAVNTLCVDFNLLAQQTGKNWLEWSELPPLPDTLGLGGAIIGESNGALLVAVFAIPVAEGDGVVLDLQEARSCSCDVILEAVRRDADLSDVPIVVCSADEEFLQSRRPLLQGLHCDLLAKPCDLESLLEMIENALADQSESAPRPVKEHRVPEAVTVSPNPRSRDHGFTAQLAD